MFKSRSFMVGACILSLAIGYLAGKRGSSSSKEDGAVETSPTSPQSRRTSRDTRPRSSGDDGLLDALLEGRNITEVPAADLAALIARLSKYDPNMNSLARTRQSYQPNSCSPNSRQMISRKSLESSFPIRKPKRKAGSPASSLH
ncbi:MAG: hypothetical protein ABJQ29_07790 [Luteolibacter sp.]